MKTILRRRIAAALSFVALIFVFPHQVQASHFRGGFMTASIAADGTVTINAETLWRTNAVSRVTFVRILNFPSRTTAISSISVSSSTVTSTDTSDPSFTRTVQQFSTSLSSLAMGSYIIRWDSCCRISGIANAPESSFSLETVVHFDGTANSAPNILSSVITGVAAGFEYSQNINATDPDSTPLSYKFLVGATSPDFGPSSQIPGITVSTVGAIKIPATNTAGPAGDQHEQPGWRLRLQGANHRFLGGTHRSRCAFGRDYRYKLEPAGPVLDRKSVRQPGKHSDVQYVGYRCGHRRCCHAFHQHASSEFDFHSDLGKPGQRKLYVYPRIVPRPVPTRSISKPGTTETPIWSTAN